MNDSPDTFGDLAKGAQAAEDEYNSPRKRRERWLELQINRSAKKQGGVWHSACPACGIHLSTLDVGMFPKNNLSYPHMEECPELDAYVHRLLAKPKDNYGSYTISRWQRLKDWLREGWDILRGTARIEKPIEMAIETDRITVQLAEEAEGEFIASGS